MTKSNVKITAFEVENVKRVRAVALAVEGKALTVIGGRNGQGKTSTLDAIMWTLGGDRFKPSTPLREGAEKLATKVVLSNGIVVERRGVDGSLRVTDETEKRAGQQLLNEFVNAFALDLPRFMQAGAADKAKMLLDCYPDLGNELIKLNLEAKRLYDERHALGTIVERKKKYAQEMPYHQDAPIELLSGAEMTQRLQDALRRNAENDRLRREVQSVRIAQGAAAARVKELQRQLAVAQAELGELDAKLANAERATAGLQDSDTTELQRELEQIDAVNARVRQNLDKARAETESADLAEQYRAMTTQLEDVRARRIRLLASVAMPLPDLKIDEDGQLLFRGRRWDGMSGSEQLRVAVAICAAIKPQCGFVLLDGLERMDPCQLGEFAQWLSQRDLQAIGTRVGSDSSCTIVIEDGSALESATPAPDYKF